MTIPTPRFLRHLILAPLIETDKRALYSKPQLVEAITSDHKWADHIDVSYDSNYTKMHLRFDNWQELFNIIMDDKINTLKKKYFKIIDQTIKQHRIECNQNRSEFFKLIEFFK